MERRKHLTSAVVQKERSLKLAQFSFADGGGGAAKAAYRLHSAMGREGVDASLFVLRKQTDDPSVTSVASMSALGSLAPELAPRLDQIPLILFGVRGKFLSTGWYGAFSPISLAAVKEADVICLYWTTRGLLGIRQIGQLLMMGKPVVWRLSDMWPFTGGCHYADTCDRFTQECGNCPQLGSKRTYDLTRYLLRSKLKHWVKGDLTIVAPSQWMAKMAGESRLFRDRSIQVIPTGVDCDVFRPIDRSVARSILRLPPKKPLILLGAASIFSDPRKGGNTIRHLISQLPREAQNLDEAPGLVIFGTSQRPTGIPSSVPVYPMGIIRDEAMLSLTYAASDLFIAPSREENLANTVLEAMACGLPILAYRVGGMIDAIEHKTNGLLFENGDHEGLAQGLAMLLGDRAAREKMSRESRARAKSLFSLTQRARQYKALFSSLVT